MNTLKAMTLVLLLLSPVASHAADKMPLEVDLWGLSYHTDRLAGFNELNTGVGFTYNIDALSSKSFTLAAGAGIVKDSRRNWTKYIGGKAYFSLHQSIDAGVLYFIMSRPSYNNGSPFVALLPLIRLNSPDDRMHLNFSYIPYVKTNSYTVKETYVVFGSVSF